jgi:hypothetical protein
MLHLGVEPRQVLLELLGHVELLLEGGGGLGVRGVHGGILARRSLECAQPLAHRRRDPLGPVVELR